ncbi:MAG: Zn-dependent hydrolase [Bacteroidetes bacterium]|nr:MAG: Zn-dependent hydrolase [Bacteroidota bacterium]
MGKTGLLVLLAVFCFPLHSQPLPKANQERLVQRLQELAQFKESIKGRVGRVAFSRADLEARQYIMEQMREAGLEVYVDFAGNIIGRRAGSNEALEPIAFGSHIDTVPNGGDYDGCVGSIGALEVMTLLHEHGIRTEHPLEMIIFTDEEGGLTGSRALVGKLAPDALDLMTHSGKTIGEGIRFVGGDPERLDEVRRSKGDLHAFLELHIEQGAILESKGLQIGVVEGIVGIEWWGVTVEGFANHAGTTPMNMRQDAVLAGARLALAVNEIVNSFEGRQVGTVGRFEALPGAPNVIPGKVLMSLEIRDLDREKIWSIYRKIEERARTIEKETGCRISFDHLNVSAIPAPTDPRIRAVIAQSAEALGLSYLTMPSGAGHDAQDMAQIAPTGMIFIPSVGGISHSPEEYSRPEDIANGVNVLLHSILALDRLTLD